MSLLDQFAIFAFQTQAIIGCGPFDISACGEDGHCAEKRASITPSCRHLQPTMRLEVGL
jgi:hypothetical protein